MCSKSFQKIFLSILKYFDIFDKSSIFESEMYTEANMASCVCYWRLRGTDIIDAFHGF
jgi:hypothetical protein